MEALLDPVGFLADVIAISNALGFYTPAQREQSDKLHTLIGEAHESIRNLGDEVELQTNRIKSLIATATVVEVRSRLENITIPSKQLELLIKLLLLIKDCAPTIVFAIIVKYKMFNTAATLGFAGTSCDAIEELVYRVDRFYRGLHGVEREKTAYLNVRIRGKYDSEIENFCSAIMSAVATEVCNLPVETELANSMECKLEPSGAKKIVLLHPAEYGQERHEFDRLRRVFVVGDTRSGKSTLGNALLRRHLFKVSKGMTGSMRIESGERKDQIGDDIWVTQIYDTPGLNDKDGLDVLYQTSIEDEIRILQRASSLVMTVSVDGGITQSAFKALDHYKELFGESVASMLLVVLTINEPAEFSELQATMALNWPTVSGLDSRIRKSNLFCVSLFDLRQGYDCASRTAAEEIVNVCRSMPMKLIETLAKRYREVRDALLQKWGNLDAEVQKLVDDGWQAYDILTNLYENSSYVKLTNSEDHWFLDGFVMKRTSRSRRALALVSMGCMNVIRKVAIHVQCSGSSAQSAWRKFSQENDDNNHSSDLMASFGDMLDRRGLAVIVRELGVTFVGTLRVDRYEVRIFNPTSYSHEEISAYLQDVLNGKVEDLRPELLGQLINSVIPPVIRRNGKRKARRHTQTSG